MKQVTDDLWTSLQTCFHIQVHWEKHSETTINPQPRSLCMNQDTTVPDPQGQFLGIPYDFRRPTLSRIKARFWNPADDRLLTPMAFGWGYAVNLRALF